MLTVRVESGLAFISFVAVGFVTASCNSDDRVSSKPAELRKRCESIILKRLLERPFSENSQLREFEVLWMRPLPPKLAEAKLMAALKDPLPNVQLTAAEILLDNTGVKHMPQIENAFKQFKPITSSQKARLAAVRLRLGMEDAIAEVHRWAVLDSNGLQKIAPWMCAMHPQIRQPKEGRCPICAMNLVDGLRPRLSEDDFEAQFIALRALAAQKGELLPNLARAVLAGNAGPLWRLRAAHVWAKHSPTDALPHLHLFFHSNDGHVMQELLMILSVDFPKESVHLFQAALKKYPAGSVSHLTATEGLVHAGHKEHLELIRRIIELPAKDADATHIQTQAFVTLGKCGTEEDITRLSRHLEGRFCNEAARAILRAMDRLDDEH